MRTAIDWMRSSRFDNHAGAPTQLGVGGSRSLPIDQWALAQIERRLDDAAIRLELWDGAAVGAGRGAARAHVLIGDRGTLYGLIWDGEVAFGDRFSDGRIQVKGDLAYLLEAAYRSHSHRLVPWGLRLGSNDLSRSRDNVHRHYDLGNEFYRLWLDEQLLYTCAYFPTPDTSLEDAQVAKMDLVCRKLQLTPGDRVIEAGCGWGALALHMAQHYGVTVRAYNVSREQMAHARRRASESGLTDRVEFIEEDYRDITGTCDKFVSVGMLEHVGEGQLRELGVVLDRTLDRRRGRGFLHFIGRNAPEPLSRWIRKRIFPGAYPPALSEVTAQVLEPWRFSVLDIENLRLHYQKTLEHWLARFDAATDRVVSDYGEQFARAWRLYLVGSVIGFKTGSLQLFQITVAREPDNTVPWTRSHLALDRAAGR